jgi:L-lactate dehydrogenase complex protein LldE
VPSLPSIAFFPTCIVDTLSPGPGAAAARVLGDLGHEVSALEGATCCGQPAWNSGFAPEAARVAATTLKALEQCGADLICVPSGSCVTMMRLYWPELFRLVGDEDLLSRAAAIGPRIREFSEIAAGSDVRGRFEARVAYHRSCHMSRELGIVAPPENLLDGLDGCERIDWRADLCCGFGGTFAVKQPEISVAMADAKIDSLLESEADVVVGCDLSCLMHLEGRLRRLGSDLPVLHLAEVLDRASRGSGP